MSASGARLSGKVAIVTGAARGVGEATARLFSAEGAAVVCVDVNATEVERTAARISEAGGIASAVVADVASMDGNALAVNRADAEFGGLDIFHANAAVQILGNIEQLGQSQWDELYRTNLWGAAMGARHAIPSLRRRGGGSIIFTASLLGIVGDADLPAYGAMKGGLRAMCRSMAAAYGADKIRVNTICPGDIETPILDAYFEGQSDPEEARARIEQAYPLGRFATPLDIAYVALFLASDEAGYVSGIDVVVDGGLLAKIY
jgi:NAD(P)-dependent dehydrogenase (short-subunit alcohol dehydrogenase family)